MLSVLPRFRLFDGRLHNFSCAPRSCFAPLLLALIALSPRIASAQPSSDKSASDQLFQAGLAEMLTGKYADGCPKLAESYRLFPRPGTLFTLADCEAGWGHPATAIRHYDSYLDQFSKMAPAEQQAQREKGREARAKEQREALAAQVGRVTLTLPPHALAGLIVKLNGAAVDGQDLGAAVTLDPGKHVAAVQAPDGAITETPFALGVGETKKVFLAIPSSALPTSRREGENVTGDGAAKHPAASSEKPGWHTAAMWTGIGLAAVGTGVGIGFSVSALAKQGEAAEVADVLKYRTEAPKTICQGDLRFSQPWRDEECSQMDSLLEDRDTFKAVAIIGFAAAGIGAATALTFDLLPGGAGPSNASMTIVPVVSASAGGIMVGGAF